MTVCSLRGSLPDWTFYFGRYEESFLSPKQDSLFIVMQYCDGGDLASRCGAVCVAVCFKAFRR
jgi:hypothetical protein